MKGRATSVSLCQNGWQKKTKGSQPVRVRRSSGGGRALSFSLVSLRSRFWCLQRNTVGIKLTWSFIARCLCYAVLSPELFCRIALGSLTCYSVFSPLPGQLGHAHRVSPGSNHLHPVPDRKVTALPIPAIPLCPILRYCVSLKSFACR